MSFPFFLSFSIRQLLYNWTYCLYENEKVFHNFDFYIYFRTENQDSDSARSTSPAGLKAAMLNGTGGSKQSRGGGTPTAGGDISSDECNGDSSPSTATAVSDKIKINGNGGASSNGGTNGSANTNGGSKMATSVEDGSNNNGLDSIPCA